MVWGNVLRLADVCHEVAETDDRRAYTVCGLILPARFAAAGLLRSVNCHECKAGDTPANPNPHNRGNRRGA
jgi:hypothetical protein